MTEQATASRCVFATGGPTATDMFVEGKEGNARPPPDRAATAPSSHLARGNTNHKATRKRITAEQERDLP